MLEEGGVIDTGGEHHHGGLSPASWRRDALQRLAQHGAVILDGGDAVLGKEVREEVHHRLAVLEHVGNAGRCAAIVLQHVELVLAHPDDVGADDMGIDLAGRRMASHLRHIGLVLDHQLKRNAPGLENVLAVIDIVDEGVERLHPLLDAGCKAPPLRRRQDARDDVEGNEALCGLIAAVDGEGDAEAAEDGFGLAQLALEIGRGLLRQPLVEPLPWLAYRAVGVEHFVEHRPHGSSGCPMLRCSTIGLRRLAARPSQAHNRHIAEFGASWHRISGHHVLSDQRYRAFAQPVDAHLP